MSNYDKYEEEINIFTLFWFVLSKWRSILIVAIIGLVLGTGYAVVSSGGNEDSGATTETTEESAEALIAQQAYEATLARVESLEKYLTEAAIMQMNPYDLYRGTINFLIEAPHNELTAVNADVYSFVWDGKLSVDLEKIGPYTINELDCLYGFSQSVSTEPAINENEIGQAIQRITIVANTKEEAQVLLGQMEASLHGFLDSMVDEGKISNYQMMSTSIKNTVSTNIGEYQANMRSKYDAERENLDICKMALNTGIDIPPASVTNSKLNVTTIAKYSLVGLVAGFVFGVIVWIVIYFLSDKLYTVSNRERKFNVKQLGTIHDYGKLNGISRWIGQKLGGINSCLPIEEQRKVLSLNVKNEIAKKVDIKKVFLASSSSEHVEAICGLKASLTAAGFEVLGYGNVLGRADVLLQLAQCDAVIIVEDNNHTSISVVEAEVRAIKEYTNNLLGMIVVQNKL